MKRKAKLFLGLVLCIAMIVSIVACAETPATPATPPAADTPAGTPADTPPSAPGDQAAVTLRIFYGWTDHEVYVKEVAEMYTAENPHVSFEFISGTVQDLLPAMVQQRDYPNISLIPDGFTATYAREGLLLELSDRPIAAFMPDGMRATHTVDGGLYGISTGLGVYGIFYNKELFAEAGIVGEPSTMSELRDAVDKLNAAGITPFIAGFGAGWPQGQYLRWGGAGAFTQNAPLTTQIDAGERRFDDPDVISMFDDIFGLIRLIMDNMTDDSLLLDTGEAETKFGLGEAAMYMLGDWAMYTMEGSNPNASLRSVTGFMPIIVSNNTADNRYLTFFNAGHSIFRDADNVDEAVKFFDFLFANYDHVMRGLGIPGAFTNSDTSFANEFVQDMLASINEPNMTWNDMEFLKLPPIFGAIDASMDNFVHGRMNQQQVFEELQRGVEMALAVR